MKPVTLLRPPQDVKQADTAMFERERTLHTAIDELYFIVEIEPDQGVLDGTSVIDATTFTFSVEDFPPLVTTQRRRNVRLRGLWPKTRVQCDVWYTSDINSTNNFNLGYRVRQLGAGMLITAPGVVTVSDFTAPGPAVAGTILRATHVSTGTMLPVPLVVDFTFNRRGPDAHAGDFRWLLIVFTLTEAA